MKKIGIIGAGFSGTLAAIHLIRTINEPVELLLIDAKNNFNKGIAYSPYSKLHLLNVPAAKMSAFANESDHFLNWLLANEKYAKTDKGILARSFVPRYLYGEYLQHLWQITTSNLSGHVNINFIDASVTNLEIKNEKYILTLSNKEINEVDICVIATGNNLPGNPAITNSSFLKSAKYFQNPWDNSSVKNINSKLPVLIIGNGLTMVDTVIGLLENGAENDIHSISPNGFNILPHRFSEIKYSALIDELPEDASLIEIVRLFNKHIKIVRQFGLSAEPVIDSIRPFTQKIWQRLSNKERKIFMSRFRHLWGVARHRIPVHIHDKIQHLRIENKLHIHAGKILDVSEIGDCISVLFYNKRKKTDEQLFVSRVINCTGPETNLQRVKNSFLHDCLKKGIISQDELKLGINVDPQTYQVINDSGKKHRTLFAIGTNLRGILWESTAVNELRTQAENLASNVISLFKSEPVSEID